jgi:ketosteroid isomerase-like protein
MTDNYPLATEPEGITDSLLRKFNSGKVEAMMSLYDPAAVFVADDGTVVTDHNDIAKELAKFLDLGLPMTATARHLFVADNIVQIVLDWSLDGTGSDGNPLHLAGTASDIARRGSDGYWRYLIDNPFGTEVRSAQ